LTGVSRNLFFGGILAGTIAWNRLSRHNQTMGLLGESDNLQRKRDDATAMRTWQVRVGELVHEKGPTFFGQLVDLIETEVNRFNNRFGFRPPVSGLLVTKVSDKHIILQKNDTPYMRREIILRSDGPVEINTTLARHPRTTEETTERWHFGAKPDGDVYLDNKTTFGCKDELLSGIAELFE
jgi:hypothetical protein